MSKPNSRKHLLGQQVVATNTLSRRLSVRVPSILSNLVEEGYKAEGISRNRWFSETMIRFRKRQIMDRLALPFDPEDDSDQDTQMTASDKQWYEEEVDRALALLVKETYITTNGGTSLPIRFTDEGLAAMADLLKRIEGVRSLPPVLEPDGTVTDRAIDLSDLSNVRTVLAHAALWDRLMEGRDIQEVAKLVYEMNNPIPEPQLEIPLDEVSSG